MKVIAQKIIKSAIFEPNAYIRFKYGVPKILIDFLK